MNLSKDKLILALVAAGFLTTLVEVRYLHRGAVRETAVAWIPTISSGVAFLASVAALLGAGAVRKAGGGVLALVAVAGLLGVYFHTKLQPAAFLKLFETTPKPQFAEPPNDDFAAFEAEAKREDATGAPALAPLGITGLALIGAVASLGTGARHKE